MSEIFLAAPGAHEGFSAANHAAGDAHWAAGSADHGAHVAAAATALGPIGAGFLAAYAPAQANCLAAALQVGYVHHAIGLGTIASKAAMIAADTV